MKEKNNLDNLVINQIELLLSEKRTSLSFLRTGIAVFALPLSVLSILIATSRQYNILHVLPLILPLLLLCALLIVLAFYLVIRSIRRIHHYDGIINRLKERSPLLSEIIE